MRKLTYRLSIRTLDVLLLCLSPSPSRLFEDELFEVKVIVALGGCDLVGSLLVGVSRVLD